MTEQPGIYAIVHIHTRRYYIGSASNISKRWHIHRKTLADNAHRNRKLQNAWNKYSEEEFRFFIIEITRDLTEREQFWIDELDGYKNGFNLCPLARSSRGRFISETEREMRRAILDNCRSAAQSVEAKTKRAQTRRREGTLGQKLTWEQATEIRRQYGSSCSFGRGRKQQRNGGVTLSSLAEKYGVNYVTIYDVVKGKTWKTDPNQKT